MEVRNKATSIDLFSLKTRQMRAFHMSWFAFFLCFFSWFGIAPLMAIVREELTLSKQQIGNTIIASVAITIVARLFIGWLCDRIGPRLCYTFLLMIGSIQESQGRLKEATEQFKKVTVAEPNNPLGYYYLGRALLKNSLKNRNDEVHRRIIII